MAEHSTKPLYQAFITDCRVEPNHRSTPPFAHIGKLLLFNTTWTHAYNLDYFDHTLEYLQSCLPPA
jgi:hypothetical protein